MMMKHLSILFALLMAGAGLKAQTPSLPMESQRSLVTQRVGISDITVTYYSPAVKGRKIWGELVPYNQVWRAGANWNTVINFTHDVTINGNKLAAGSYGLHMIPTENEWTIIFSKTSNAWGSFTYTDKEDALRIKTKATANAFQEWLSYDFTERAADHVTLALSWEKFRIPFRIDVDVDKIVIENFRSRVSSPTGDTSAIVSQQAAEYCLDHDRNLEEALTWADKSIKLKPGFTIYMIKSELQAKLGKKDEAAATQKKAMALGTKDEINQYGYRMLNQKRYTEAVDLFKLNLKNNPDDWNMYDSLGEGYSFSGDKKKAVDYYNKALAKAPEDQQERIKGILTNLKGN
jgi:tetratricopeptide (TPR) repeat protein